MTATSCRPMDRRPGGARPWLALVTAIVLLSTACGFGQPASETAEPVVTPEVPVTQAAAPPSPTATTTAPPRFASSIAPIDDGTAARLSASWRPGCPVPLKDLRLVTVTHWGFDRQPHQGEVVLHTVDAEKIRSVFADLFEAGFPIEQVRLVDEFGADDDRSMAANNTSGFNCRRARDSARWSEHASGRAIDINPVQNPYLAPGGAVLPPAGKEIHPAGRHQARPHHR